MRPHEECKDTYKGPVCNCKHGYKRKHGHCVGKKITHKHTHTFISTTPIKASVYHCYNYNLKINYFTNLG
jgi:hypothetical protein